MVAYRYELIVKPARALLKMLCCLNLVQSQYPGYLTMTNGELNDRLVSYK